MSLQTNKRKPGALISGIIRSMTPVIKSRYFYIGLLSVIAGAGLNFASQTYLHNYMIQGKTLPMLSDLILSLTDGPNLSLEFIHQDMWEIHFYCYCL